MCNIAFTQDVEPVDRHVNINFSPLSAFMRSPRIRMGLELFGSKSFIYGVDVGYGYSSMVPKGADDGWQNNYRAIEVRPEIKFITETYSNRLRYFAFEAFYISCTDVFYNSFYNPIDVNSVVDYKRADFELRKVGCHFKYGIIRSLSDKVTLEYYCGIGLARRIKEYSRVVLSESKYDYGSTWGGSWLGDFKDEVDKNILHFALGIKLGLNFTK